jgi:hypothetical protein
MRITNELLNLTPNQQYTTLIQFTTVIYSKFPRPPQQSHDDVATLIHDTSTEMMLCLKKYDPNRGSRLYSYLWTIGKNYMRRSFGKINKLKEEISCGGDCDIDNICYKSKE